MMHKLTQIVGTGLLLIGLLATGTANGQEDGTQVPPGDVTYDQVNDVASKMYCPICEMQPLDSCHAQTCIDWREIIRQKLAEGQSQQQIIDYFVSNYGERVVGLPQNKGLRIFSLIGPMLAAILGLVIAYSILRRWQRPESEQQPRIVTDSPAGDDDYHRRLEDDLRYD